MWNSGQALACEVRAPSCSTFTFVDTLGKLTDYLRRVTAARMTSKRSAALFQAAMTYSRTMAFVLPDQLWKVDKARLVKKFGAVSAKALSADLCKFLGVFTELRIESPIGASRRSA